ncbi:MAG: 6-phosphogluconolactonase [Candidatus Eremiobacteraeota bacterium]|nr:6-phosphogluconolactonase [Candidatus Eremiobacteraeota bacterium]
MAAHVEVLDDLEAISNFALKRLERALANQQGDFHLALAGGSTPKHLYELMARQPLPWDRIHLWWGDERHVPHDHQDSNFRMVRQAMLDNLSLSPDQIHPWPYDPDPARAAEAYDQALRAQFGGPATFNLTLLGMGDDGHTASLFPGTSALKVEDRLAVANRVEQLDTWRLTLTYPALARSNEVLFLVAGEGKAPALEQVLESGRLPSSKVRARDQLIFAVDRAAAQRLAAK